MPGQTSSLANDPTRCHLINLGSDDHGGGPFVVTQDAYDPEDARLSDATFVLLRSGQWIDELALAKLPPEDQLTFLFASSAEAMERIGSLQGAAEIVRVPLTEQDLRERVAAWRSGGFAQRVGALVERFRAEKTPR